MFSLIRWVRIPRQLVLCTIVALVGVTLAAASPAFGAPRVYATLVASPNPAPAWQVIETNGVHVTGSGYQPSAFVQVQFCSSRDNCYAASDSSDAYGMVDFWARTGAAGSYKVKAYQYRNSGRLGNVAEMDGPLYIQ